MCNQYSANVALLFQDQAHAHCERCYARVIAEGFLAMMATPVLAFRARLSSVQCKVRQYVTVLSMTDSGLLCCGRRGVLRLWVLWWGGSFRCYCLERIYIFYNTIPSISFQNQCQNHTYINVVQLRRSS